jgi:hypothetical protein
MAGHQHSTRAIPGRLPGAIGEAITSAGSPLAGSPVTYSGQPWLRRLTGPWAAGAVLAGFWIFMLASRWHKGPTYDEPRGV